MGSMHAANVSHKIPGANPSAVCDIRPDVAQQVAEAHGIKRVVRNLHELLEDPSIEAVMVITSTLTTQTSNSVTLRRKRAMGEVSTSL